MSYRIRPRYQARPRWPAAPGCAVPGCAVPGCAVPGCAVPGCAVPGCAVPGCAVPGCAALLGHAGGMKAISRRLSAATPPEPHANKNASHRDASMHWQSCRTRGQLAGIPSGCGCFGAHSGAVAVAQPTYNCCDASGIGAVALMADASGIRSVTLGELRCLAPGGFSFQAGFDLAGSFLSKTPRTRQSTMRWT
jgi:hypothetical protein